MQGKPPAALGCGAYVAGVAAAVALLGGSPDTTVTAVAVAGFCLGIVAGGLVVTRTRLLGHRVTARFTAGALVGLGVWVTWTGLQSGGGSRYQFAIGSVFLAVVGWAVLTGGTRTPWVELYGYEATDDRLRIATEFGRDITYATDSVDDLDGVVGVLDDHLPQL